MPIYGYKCLRCGREFELLKSVDDSDHPSCPECEGQAKRVFHPVGIIFKGSGFHVTDYPSKSRKSAEAKENPAGSNGDSSSKKDANESSSSEGGSKEPAKT